MGGVEFADEGEEGECLPMLSGEAAQSVFDGDCDEIEIRQEWQDENTLHEWDEGISSLSHRWIPRKDAQQLMSGMNVNLIRAMMNVDRQQWVSKTRRMADQGS